MDLQQKELEVLLGEAIRVRVRVMIRLYQAIGVRVRVMIRLYQAIRVRVRVMIRLYQGTAQGLASGMRWMGIRGGVDGSPDVTLRHDSSPIAGDLQAGIRSV